jgi:hypothetical protein
MTTKESCTYSNHHKISSHRISGVRKINYDVIDLNETPLKQTRGYNFSLSHRNGRLDPNGEWRRRGEGHFEQVTVSHAECKNHQRSS